MKDNILDVLSSSRVKDVGGVSQDSGLLGVMVRIESTQPNCLPEKNGFLLQPQREGRILNVHIDTSLFNGHFPLFPEIFLSAIT